MGYDILTVRTAGQGNGSLYPVIASGGLRIELEDLDGPEVRGAGVTALSVSEVRNGELLPRLRLTDIKAELTITDARVAIASPRYRRWGWIGFRASVPPAGGWDTPRGVGAVSRRRRQMLVGHTRYAWLRSVGARVDASSSQDIRLAVVSRLDGVERQLYLACRLAKPASAVEVAGDIARRAARYGLAHRGLDGDAVRSRFEALISAPPLVPDHDDYSSYDLPAYSSVSPTTAYPAAVGSDR